MPKTPQPAKKLGPKQKIIKATSAESAHCRQVQIKSREEWSRTQTWEGGACV